MPKRKNGLSNNYRPFATILGSSDSRVPPERSRIQLLLQNLLPGFEGIDPQFLQQLSCADNLRTLPVKNKGELPVIPVDERAA